MNNHLRVVFNANRRIYCVHFTLIAKVEALESKYPDGLRGYLEKHNVLCNPQLAVTYAMAEGYLGDVCEDLGQHGIIPRQEAFVFDASMDALLLPEGSKVNVGVDWLKGRAHGNGTLVEYIQED